MEDIKMENKIAAILKDLGVPAHIKGYEYLKTAISLFRLDRQKFEAVTKMLYPEIARQYNTTPQRAERAIRHAIEVAWERGNPETESRLFGFALDPTKNKPTNSEFLATVVEELRLRENLERSEDIECEYCRLNKPGDFLITKSCCYTNDDGTGIEIIVGADGNLITRTANFCQECGRKISR